MLLVDSLYAQINPDLANRIAATLGEQPANVTRGLQGSMAAILGGLLARTGDASAMQSIVNTVTNSSNDEGVLNDQSWLDAPPTSPAFTLGSQFTSSTFGNRVTAVTDALAGSSGLPASAVTRLLQIAATLAVAALGRRVRDGALNVASFTRVISTERDSIVRALPAGLASAIGLEERAPDRPERVQRDEVPRSAPTYAEKSTRAPGEPEKPRSKFWPIAATVGALALIWAVWPKSRDVEVESTVGGEVVAPVVPLRAAGVRLPNGATLAVAETGPEGRIVGFLNDPETPNDESTWFVIDRMKFESNSANLSPESDAAIRDVAAILAAFPDAKVRIAAHTDKTGSAPASLKLSRDRAANVKRALVERGTDASRITAEGFGHSKPAEGGASNERVSLLVSKKKK